MPLLRTRHCVALSTASLVDARACNLFPRSMPLVPRAPSLKLAITMGALTHTRFHLCCRRFIVPRVLIENRDRAVESSLCLTLSCSGTVGARLMLIHRLFFPSVLSFVLSFFSSSSLSAMSAPIARARALFPLTIDCLTSEEPPVSNAAFRQRDLGL
jgi:hypothetical protein